MLPVPRFGFGGGFVLLLVLMCRSRVPFVFFLRLVDCMRYRFLFWWWFMSVVVCWWLVLDWLGSFDFAFGVRGVC